MVVMLVLLVTMESVDFGIVDIGIVPVQKNSEWPNVTTCAMEMSMINLMNLIIGLLVLRDDASVSKVKIIDPAHEMHHVNSVSFLNGSLAETAEINWTVLLERDSRPRTEIFNQKLVDLKAAENSSDRDSKNSCTRLTCRTFPMYFL